MSYNCQLLEELAPALLDKEILEGEQLRAQLGLVHQTTDIEQWLQTGKSLGDKVSEVVTSNNGAI